MGLSRNNWEFLEDIFLPILSLFSRKKGFKNLWLLRRDFKHAEFMYKTGQSQT